MPISSLLSQNGIKKVNINNKKMIEKIKYIKNFFNDILRSHNGRVYQKILYQDDLNLW
jgi:hypothetical protein